MIHSLLLQSLRSSCLSIHSSTNEVLQVLANSIIAGTVKVEQQDLPVCSTKGEFLLSDDIELENNSRNPFDKWEMGSIAIIPLSGVMVKKAYWWRMGVDDIAEIIRLAYQSDKIAGVILKGNTPGGATDSLYVLEDVLANRTKPTFMLVDGMLCSCGYIAGSYCDRIYAVNKMCEVGSIGVFAQLMFWKKGDKDESWGHYEVIEVYPEESKDKNLPEREAADGKPELLKERLSKLAQYFQTTVKANRKKLKADAAGVLTGGTFFAYEAEQLGMIDGIKNLEAVIEEITELSQKQNTILSFI